MKKKTPAKKPAPSTKPNASSAPGREKRRKKAAPPQAARKPGVPKTDKRSELQIMQALVEERNELHRNITRLKAAPPPTPWNLPEDMRFLAYLSNMLVTSLSCIPSRCASPGPLSKFDAEKLRLHLLRCATIAAEQPIPQELQVELTGLLPREACRIGDIVGASVHALVWTLADKYINELCFASPPPTIQVRTRQGAIIYTGQLGWIMRRTVPLGMIAEIGNAEMVAKLKDALPTIPEKRWSTLEADLRRERVAVARARGYEGNQPPEPPKNDNDINPILPNPPSELAIKVKMLLKNQYLTTEQILDYIGPDSPGKEMKWGATTIKTTLAEMVRRGEIGNKRGKGCGYFNPEFSAILPFSP